MIRIYTDGAAQGNPGPGGYGTILKFNQVEKELSEGFRLTTNNRMELLAVIKGLEAIKKSGIPITIYSDSKYVVDAVEKGWLWGWEKKNFKDKKKCAKLKHFQLYHIIDTIKIKLVMKDRILLQAKYCYLLSI